MYIEFKIAYNHRYSESLLEKYLAAWSQKHQIRYRTKSYKDTLRVTFDNDEHYTFFSITWPHTYNWTNYRVIRDLNNKI